MTCDYDSGALALAITSMKSLNVFKALKLQHSLHAYVLRPAIHVTDTQRGYAFAPETIVR